MVVDKSEAQQSQLLLFSTNSSCQSLFSTNSSCQSLFSTNSESVAPKANREHEYSVNLHRLQRSC